MWRKLYPDSRPRPDKGIQGVDPAGTGRVHARAGGSRELAERLMTVREDAELILAFARVLYVNGESTEETVATTKQLAAASGLSAVLLPRWGELQLEVADKNGSFASQVAVDPAGVNMHRVAATMNAMEDMKTGRL